MKISYCLLFLCCFVFIFFFQAKLSLRLEYIPPKPAKNIDGEISAVDATELGADPGLGDGGLEGGFGDEAEAEMGGEGAGDAAR